MKLLSWATKVSVASSNVQYIIEVLSILCKMFRALYIIIRPNSHKLFHFKNVFIDLLTIYSTKNESDWWKKATKFKKIGNIISPYRSIVFDKKVIKNACTWCRKD